MEAKAQSPRDLRAYIDKYIERVPESGCWIWVGADFKNGYGQTRLVGMPHSAHRLAWVVFKGEIPENTNVLHRCDVRACCNPSHLFLGTQQENLHDMIGKKRHLRMDGSRRNAVKLTTDKVQSILADTRSQDAIAKDHGVSQSMVSLVKLRKSWRSV